MNLQIRCKVSYVPITIGPRTSSAWWCDWYKVPETIPVETVTCAENAGDPGVRINTDFADADDTFEIQSRPDHNEGKLVVCARRTDESSGWGMNLQIRCKVSYVPITIGPRTSSAWWCDWYKVPETIPVETVTCAENAGDPGV